MENPLQRIAHLLTRHIPDEAPTVIDAVYQEIARLHNECPYRRVGCAMRTFFQEEVSNGKNP